MYIELHTSSAFSFLDGASLPATLIERAAELGLSGRGAARSRRPLRRAAVLSRRQSRRPQSHRRRRTDDRRSDPEIAQRPAGAPTPVDAAGARRSRAEGYRQSLPRHHARQAARRRRASRYLTLEDLAGQTTGLIALAGRPALRGRAAWRRRARRRSSSRCSAAARCGSSCSVISGATSRPMLQSLLDLAGGVPGAGDGVQRRAVRDAGSAAALRRPHLHPAQDDAGAGGAAADGECRAVSEAAGGDGAAVRGSAAGARGHRSAGRAARVHAGESRLSLSRLSGAGGRDAGVVPAPARAGRRARSLSAVSRSRRARRSRASSISSRSSILPATSSSSGTSSISAGSRAFSCRGAGRRPTAPSAMRSGITAVDPVGMDLLFERFLSEERGEWPDIDLDLPSGDRRERVIQYVYERYGKLGAAMTANVITYRGRSAAREVGKVLGLRRADEIDRLARTDEPVRVRRSRRDDRAAPARGRPRSRRSARTGSSRRLWREMQDLPRHLGQHSGGMVVCQGRLDEVVPLENASMPGRVVVQWDKDDCADLGIVKVDLLGLGMMAVLEEAIHDHQQAGLRAARADPQDRGRPVEVRSRASAARRSGGLSACCSRPTRSACSRSSRARRWRRCRA